MASQVVIVDLDGLACRVDETNVDWIEDPAEVALCFRRDGQVVRVLNEREHWWVAELPGVVLDQRAMETTLRKALEAEGRSLAGSQLDVDSLWNLVELQGLAAARGSQSGVIDVVRRCWDRLRRQFG